MWWANGDMRGLFPGLLIVPQALSLGESNPYGLAGFLVPLICSVALPEIRECALASPFVFVFLPFQWDEAALPYSSWNSVLSNPVGMPWS